MAVLTPTGRAATPRARKPASAPASADPGTRRLVKPAEPARPPAPASHATGMQLHTAEGARKYLTTAEREGFLAMAGRADRAIQTLCMTLAYSGCRLSEALALTSTESTSAPAWSCSRA